MDKKRLHVAALRNACRELARLRNEFPEDLDCSDYRSFRKHAPFISVYPFREEALLKLVDLAYNCYTLGARFNRRLLFDGLRKYYQKCPQPYAFSEAVCDRLFELFEAEVGKPGPVLVALDRLLSGQRLRDEQIYRLLELAFDSSAALDRVLRYPYRNSQISAWADYYYEDNRLRNKRLELTSWLLDANPDFVPSAQVLYDDQALAYEQEEGFAFNLLYPGKMRPVIRLLDTENFLSSPANADTAVANSGKTWLELKTGYHANTLEKNELDLFIKQALRRSGHLINHYRQIEPVELSRARIMQWAAAYSRLDDEQKIALAERFYDPKLSGTIILIAEKRKFAGLLEWLIDRLKESTI